MLPWKGGNGAPERKRKKKKPSSPSSRPCSRVSSFHEPGSHSKAPSPSRRCRLSSLPGSAGLCGLPKHARAGGHWGSSSSGSGAGEANEARGEEGGERKGLPSRFEAARLQSAFAPSRPLTATAWPSRRITRAGKAASPIPASLPSLGSSPWVVPLLGLLLRLFAQLFLLGKPQAGDPSAARCPPPVYPSGGARRALTAPSPPASQASQPDSAEAMVA